MVKYKKGLLTIIWYGRSISMKQKVEGVLKEAMKLPAIERAGLVDRLISSLDIPDKTIDTVWHREIGKRMSAYEAGKIETVSVEEVIAKYRNK